MFPNSRILQVSRYGDARPGPKGTVMTATFELDGQQFMALNGGPMFRFTEAISLFVSCESQDEVDALWAKLSVDGDGRCGWLKDKFGVSWQIIPKGLSEMLSDPDPAKSRRAMQAMLTMSKIDIAKIRAAFDEE